jgi:outer membrane biosynthesis protein TonB
MTGVFISHARVDEGRANHIARRLRRAGFTILLDNGPPGGDAWPAALSQAIAKASPIITLLSPDSTGRPWQLFEAHAGDLAGGLVVASFGEGAAPPRSLGHARTIQFSEGLGAGGRATEADETALEALVTAVQGFVEIGERGERPQAGVAGAWPSERTATDDIDFSLAHVISERKREGKGKRQDKSWESLRRSGFGWASSALDRRKSSVIDAALALLSTPGMRERGAAALWRNAIDVNEPTLWGEVGRAILPFSPFAAVDALRRAGAGRAEIAELVSPHLLTELRAERAPARGIGRGAALGAAGVAMAAVVAAALIVPQALKGNLLTGFGGDSGEPDSDLSTSAASTDGATRMASAEIKAAAPPVATQYPDAASVGLPPLPAPKATVAAPPPVAATPAPPAEAKAAAPPVDSPLLKKSEPMDLTPPAPAPEVKSAAPAPAKAPPVKAAPKVEAPSPTPPAPVSAQLTAPAGEATTVTVAAGDTLWKIASERYASSAGNTAQCAYHWSDIYRANIGTFKTRVETRETKGWLYSQDDTLTLPVTIGDGSCRLQTT